MHHDRLGAGVREHIPRFLRRGMPIDRDRIGADQIASNLGFQHGYIIAHDSSETVAITNSEGH